MVKQLLPLHSFPDNIKRISYQLTYSAYSSNTKVDIPFGVAIRPFLLHFFFKFGKDKKGTSVVYYYSKGGCNVALIKSYQPFSVKNSLECIQVVMISEGIFLHR